MLTDPNLLRQQIRIAYPEWDDMRAPATGLRIPAGLNPPTWDDVNVGWRFEGTGVGPNSDASVFAIFHLPHGYREGTNLEPHVHWQAITANAGNVYWQLEYWWLNNGEVQGGSTTIFITAAASGIALQFQLDEFADIVKANALISSTVVCILSRQSSDALDTYNNDDALLKEFDLHYRKDALGSVQDDSKWG